MGGGGVGNSFQNRSSRNPRQKAVTRVRIGPGLFCVVTDHHVSMPALNHITGVAGYQVLVSGSGFRVSESRVSGFGVAGFRVSGFSSGFLGLGVQGVLVWGFGAKPVPLWPPG